MLISSKKYEKHRSLNIKLIFAGPHESGKSSILCRYINNSFQEKPYEFLPIEFITKNIYHQETDITLEIVILIQWDTSGEEIFRPFVVEYYYGASAAIVVFDKSSNESFDMIEDFVKLVKNYIKENAVLMVIGNKSDRDSVVSIEQVQEIIIEHEAIYVEVSAKTGLGIETAFKIIVQEILNRRLEYE